MSRHDEDAGRPIEARTADEPEADARPFDDRLPAHGATPFILRERPLHAASWPLDVLDDREVEARRNLEHVGIILQRLDRQQAEITRLRKETRAILAELAA